MGRLNEREDSLIQKQGRQRKEELKLKMSMSEKIKQMVILSKQQQEIVAFRNRMEREINQSIAELKRTHEIHQAEKMQEQEMQFIGGLLKVGKIKMDELENILAMLLPSKTSEET